MKNRFLTGACIFVVLLAFVVIRQFVSFWFFDSLIFVLSMFASFEVARGIFKDTEKIFKNFSMVVSMIAAPLIFGLFIGLNVSNVAIGYTWFVIMYSLLALIILSILVNVCIYFCQQKENRKTCPIKLSLKQMLAIVYPSVPMAGFYFLNHLNDYTLGTHENIGLFMLTFLLVTVCTTDIFAMLCGMLIKGPKLCPKISPKKTISGAVSALIIGTGFGVLTFFIFSLIEPFKTNFVNLGLSFDFAWWKFLIIAFSLSVITQLGDLCESFIKRKLGIKDFGNVLPGHGGIMDRIDGMSVAALTLMIGVICLI